MSARIDLTGQRRGRLVALRPTDRRLSNGAVYWECLCDCGTVKEVSAQALRRGQTFSCGCLKMEKATKHGHYVGNDGSPTYESWQAMKARCTYTYLHGYERYGGRGISYDPSWEEFENFLADMGERPSLDHCLSRLDHDGNYEPGNVEWGLKSENSRDGQYRSVVARRAG